MSTTRKSNNASKHYQTIFERDEEGWEKIKLMFKIYSTYRGIYFSSFFNVFRFTGISLTEVGLGCMGAEPPLRENVWKFDP